MANLGRNIERLRNAMNLNQADFGVLLGTTAMTVSRWERDVNLPSSRELLKLGLLAKGARLDAWAYWERAGITRAHAQAALAPAKARAAAGRR